MGARVRVAAGCTKNTFGGRSGIRRVAFACCIDELVGVFRVLGLRHVCVCWKPYSRRFVFFEECEYGVGKDFLLFEARLVVWSNK